MNKVLLFCCFSSPLEHSLLISEKFTRFIYPGVKCRVQPLVSNTFFCLLDKAATLLILIAEIINFRLKKIFLREHPVKP